jgi:acyl-coenzyme A synthetase/AMP-(fatty) acid ligase
MATSGSTGSPRLVRLSTASLQANAAAIADCLGIRPTDRAVTTLPLHYCYGLSIVHANLHVGAAVLLTDASVTDPGFWALVREHRATSLHGARTPSRCSTASASRRCSCRT